MREIGPGALAKRLGYSSGSYLSQVAGPTPSRSISERTARSIETLLDLPDGYLDKEDSAPPAPLAVSDVVLEVMNAVEKMDRRPSASKIADIVALALSHGAPSGKVDRDFLQKLLNLAT